MMKYAISIMYVGYYVRKKRELTFLLFYKKEAELYQIACHFLGSLAFRGFISGSGGGKGGLKYRYRILHVLENFLMY